jgi:hypothetical protein
MRPLFWFLGIGTLAVGLYLAAYVIEPEYAYRPSLDAVANPERTNWDIAYDVWGKEYHAC